MMGKKTNTVEAPRGLYGVCNACKQHYQIDRGDLVKDAGDVYVADCTKDGCQGAVDFPKDSYEQKVLADKFRDADPEEGGEEEPMPEVEVELEPGPEGEDDQVPPWEDPSEVA